MFLVSSHYLDKDLALGADMGSDHNAVIMEVQSICRPLLLFRPRWTIKSENLPKWSKTIENAVIPENGSTLEIYKSLTDQLLKTSHENFTLQDSSKPKKPGQPWWNQECAERVAERAAARKRFHKYPTPSNKTLYNKANKNANDTISEAKKRSWEQFLSSLGPQTPTSRVWKFFKCMKGRAPNSIIPFSNHKDEPQDSKQSAEKFAQHYWKKISNQSTPPNKRISYVEQAFLDMTTNQDYNRQFEYHKLSSENKNLKQNPSFEKN